MSPVFDFDQLRHETLRCTKCGFCQATCPTYKETRDESNVARGRIRLIRAVMDGELPVSEGYVRRIESCLYCLSCVSTCPSGVQIDRIILAAREHYAKEKGLPWVKKVALGHVFSNNSRIRLAYSSLKIAQKTVLKVLPAERLFPKGIDVTHMPAAFRPLHSRLPAVNRVSNPNGRVLFFPGCLIDYSMPEVGESAVRVLNRSGMDVVMAKGAGCCGIPMLVAGEAEAARTLARRNVELLDQMEADAIVTACGTCGLALKKEYPYLFRDEPEMLAKAEGLAARAFDISAFLVEKAGYESQKGVSLAASVTYHDPCHLLRGMGVSAQPRTLLKGLPGVEYREMAEADRCCGAAGLFQVLHPDLSVAISERKLANISNAGSRYVASGCPACLQRIQGGLNQAGMKQRAVHLVQLLDWAGGTLPR